MMSEAVTRPNERVYWQWVSRREYDEIAAGHRTRVSVYDPPDSVRDLYIWSTGPDFPRIIGFIRSPDEASDKVHFRHISGVSKEGDFVVYRLGDAVRMRD